MEFWIHMQANSYNIIHLWILGNMGGGGGLEWPTTVVQGGAKCNSQSQSH